MLGATHHASMSNQHALRSPESGWTSHDTEVALAAPGLHPPEESRAQPVKMSAVPNEAATTAPGSVASASTDHQQHPRWFRPRRQDSSFSDTNTPISPHPIRSQLAHLWRGKQESPRVSPPENEERPANIVAELQLGLFSAALLKMKIERDEQDIPRIPVLLQYLQVVVTDSVHMPSSGHVVYRIELRYGSGMLAWVIYREMRDFFSLHAYYRTQDVAATLSRRLTLDSESDRVVPSFPKGSFTSRLTRQWQHDSKERQETQDRAYRAALTEYLTKLIKFVMFRPEANRLCRFLELSAMGLQIASLSGHLGKQGYLQIKSKSSWRDTQAFMKLPHRHHPRWFIVRESYIVIVSDIQSLRVLDVFLMDQEFEVVRKHTLRSSSLKHAPDEKDEQIVGEHQQHSTGRVSDYVKRHRFDISNAERKLKLVARSEREMEQFLLSLKYAAHYNPFGKRNRFGSFAPIRRHVVAQWLVDGRDYYWNLSEAILHAHERIYIHDWWLSPELYLRRPGTPEWRLDNLLLKKAQEGVRIYVILYNEVSNQFTPTDSGYAKTRLMSLHPNIVVQRSPSHLKTGTFYWAHHEKLCVIDEMLAFMGGFDLCFGRYDTPSHALVDDAEIEGHSGADPKFLGPVRNGAEAHIWPGQDYANERVVEWQTLSKPEMDLIPRDKVPRMPWHDTGVQIMGQPARDLCRHFCQRWNMLLRTKKHTRRMDFLLPPSDLKPEDLDHYGLRGTCEVQICRSAGPWSLGTPKMIEHSIQTAYLKAIEQSDHFVYVENQFFVSSTIMDSTEIENSIGLALVERIVRAHRDKTPWRAIIVIPATPGFPMAYDHAESGSVRLISSLQYLSIARGPHSIFARLRSVGIDPHAYIGFFSLRAWGRMRHGQLTTEQVYLHDKVLIADDRLAIIGSANINERSQRGDRDSELACIVRDEDMIPSSMAGRPYKVGRFPHTLRVRLMREHVGLDVDQIEVGVLEHLSATSPVLQHTTSSELVDETTVSATKATRIMSTVVPSTTDLHGSTKPSFFPNSLLDPLACYDSVWKMVAAHNTSIFRDVFHCVPDDEVKTWAAYKTAIQHYEHVTSSGPGGLTSEEAAALIDRLTMCCGTLIEHPTEFLEREAAAGNYLFPMDHINPVIVFD